MVNFRILFCCADLQKKLDACKEKTDETNLEIADEEEIERLQKELDEELQLECKLQEELRYVPISINSA